MNLPTGIGLADSMAVWISLFLNTCPFSLACFSHSSSLFFEVVGNKHHRSVNVEGVHDKSLNPFVFILPIRECSTSLIPSASMLKRIFAKMSWSISVPRSKRISFRSIVTVSPVSSSMKDSSHVLRTRFARYMLSIFFGSDVTYRISVFLVSITTKEILDFFVFPAGRISAFDVHLQPADRYLPLMHSNYGNGQYSGSFHLLSVRQNCVNRLLHCLSC